MKTSVMVVAIVFLTAILALILLVSTARSSPRLSGESGYCELVGECVFKDGKGYRWRQCYGAFVGYSSWFHDFRCEQAAQTI